VTITGLAKNTGKTVTFNQLVREAHDAGTRLLLASFGHDGEYRDLLLRHRKPRITVPAGAVYATVEHLAGDETSRVSLGPAGFRTVLGAVNLYRAREGGVSVQLCGLNRRSRLMKLSADPRAECELFVIDGAIDRRAAAVPEISDGVIIATGSAVGRAPDVAEQTRIAVDRLTAAWETTAGAEWPEFPGDLTAGMSWISRRGGPAESSPGNWLTGGASDSVTDLRQGDVLYLGGALTDALAVRLLDLPKQCRFSLVVRDGTRIFASPGNLSRLAARGIDVHAGKRINVIAVTVNPFNPWGPDSDPSILEEAVRCAVPEVPVVNVRSESYASRG
jgi:hypothetical protein